MRRGNSSPNLESCFNLPVVRQSTVSELFISMPDPGTSLVSSFERNNPAQSLERLVLKMQHRLVDRSHIGDTTTAVCPLMNIRWIRQLL